MRGRGAMPGAGRRVRRAPGARAPPAVRRARRGARPGRDGWDACMGRAGGGGPPSPARTFRGRRRRGRRGDPRRHRGGRRAGRGSGPPLRSGRRRGGARVVTPLGLLGCNGPDRGLPAPESFWPLAKGDSPPCGDLTRPSRVAAPPPPRSRTSRAGEGARPEAKVPRPSRPACPPRSDRGSPENPSAGCTAARVQLALSPHAERPAPPTRIRAGAAGIGVPARMIRKAPPPAPPPPHSIITPARRPWRKRRTFQSAQRVRRRKGDPEWVDGFRHRK